MAFMICTKKIQEGLNYVIVKNKNRKFEIMKYKEDCYFVYVENDMIHSGPKGYFKKNFKSMGQAIYYIKQFLANNQECKDER